MYYLQIYDIATGRLLKTLSPSISNQYNKNRATFSMNDELILSDGILWDVNSGKEIHKFDKLNETLNGVFHPNGTEVVSNTEVWDLRTFHLLKTVPSLDQMNVIFSPVNNIMYAMSVDQEMEDESHYLTSFKTLDALDYSNICEFSNSVNLTIFCIIFVKIIESLQILNFCSNLRRKTRNFRFGLQQV